MRNVCIIDDDHIFVYGVKRIMRELDFDDELSVYSNGQDALEGISKMLEEKKPLPAIIFLDLNMPIMNGWEFLDDYLKIKDEKTSQTAVYIMSSSVDPRDLVRIKSYKVIKNYILKPVTADDLEGILNA